VSRLGIGRTILIFQRPGLPTSEGDEGEKDLVLVVAGWILLEVPIFFFSFCARPFVLYYQEIISLVF
jgi:hypothetical protein